MHLVKPHSIVCFLANTGKSMIGLEFEILFSVLQQRQHVVAVSGAGVVGNAHTKAILTSLAVLHPFTGLLGYITIAVPNTAICHAKKRQ